jgi:hypothetical protein
VTHARLLVLAVALTLAGCGTTDPCRENELMPIEAPRLAVVLSDYASSAVVIVDERDEILGPFIDSGSRPPGIVATLSGDVVLPRRAPDPSQLVLIDRYQTDVLTAIPFAAPERLVQRDLRGGRTSGSSPNPQDVLALADGRWLVSRLNPAEDPGAPTLARGNDVAVLDAERHELVDRFALEADVVLDEVTYFARPAGLAAMEDRGAPRVLVGLARLSSFVLRRTGPGAVALLDADTGRAQVLELPGLSNCLQVQTVPSDAGRAIVLCRGDAFGEDESRGGLVEVAIVEQVLRETRRFAVADDASLPPPSNGLVVLDDHRLAYVSSGSVREGRTDRLVELDLRDGSARVVAESTPTPFELGDGAFDASRDELLVPDGNLRAIRRFVGPDLSEGAPLSLASACLRLPPRQVAFANPR